MDFDTPNWNADDKTDPGLTAPAGATDAQEPHDAGPSRLQLIGIAVFAVAAFFFFLVMKLPEARIQNLVIAHIRIIAQEQGFLFSAEKVRVGMLLGP
ncbi:MAG: hypothetical protein HY075_00760, partial [Deltaproteobacteria bacterium]|nr:hypothetical protein [Deltaproteobacteria bacterium]